MFHVKKDFNMPYCSTFETSYPKKPLLTILQPAYQIITDKSGTVMYTYTTIIHNSPEYGD